MATLVETVTRSEYSVLYAASSDTDPISLKLEFPTGIWQLKSASVQLSGVDSLDQGAMQLQTVGSNIIQVLPLLSVGWKNATNSWSRFDGEDFVLSEGDFARYVNLDVTASGSGDIYVYFVARRLR